MFKNIEKDNIAPNNIFIEVTLAIPKIGRKTALKILNNLNHRISDYLDLYDFLRECNIKLKTPFVEKVEFDKVVSSIKRTAELNEQLSIQTISIYDKNYPTKFKTESDLPILLYCKGNLELLNHSKNVGIIGTREPSEKAYQLGINTAKRFAEKGFNIVSGLAKGCDSAGHIGALEVNGATTAFLAHGLHMIYPKENKILADRILEKNGLLISEYPTGTAPFSNYFVERDRLQAYLSDLLIVVQTDIKGGTMHAVNHILKSNKQLVVLYPDMDDFKNHPKSRGNTFLVTEKNATPITTKEDIDKILSTYIFSLNFNNQIQDSNIGLSDEIISYNKSDKDKLKDEINYTTLQDISDVNENFDSKNLESPNSASIENELNDKKSNESDKTESDLILALERINYLEDQLSKLKYELSQIVAEVSNLKQKTTAKKKKTTNIIKELFNESSSDI
jgi:DNA processing protein